MTKAMNVDADSASFSLTGQDVTLRTGKVLELSNGSFTYTGQTVGTQIALSADLASGTFSITDQDASVTAQLNVSLDSGSLLILANRLEAENRGNAIRFVCLNGSSGWHY